MQFLVQWLAHSKDFIHVSSDGNYHLTLVLEPQRGAG